MSALKQKESSIFDNALNTLEVINGKYNSLNGVHINAGGCGIFAKLMAKAFISKGHKVSFVLTFGIWDDKGAKISNDAMNNNDLHTFIRTGWRHILLKVGDKYIDSTGVYKSKKDYIESRGIVCFSDTFPIEVLEYMLNRKNRHRWNSMFDRAYVSPISKLITKHMQVT